MLHILQCCLCNQTPTCRKNFEYHFEDMWNNCSLCTCSRLSSIKMHLPSKSKCIFQAILHLSSDVSSTMGLSNEPRQHNFPNLLLRNLTHSLGHLDCQHDTSRMAPCITWHRYFHMRVWWHKISPSEYYLQGLQHIFLIRAYPMGQEHQGLLYPSPMKCLGVQLNLTWISLIKTHTLISL